MLGGTQVCTVFARAPATAKIAFHSTRDGNLEIYIMNPDGRKQINLTWHASRDFYPAWSPTGEHIAFNSNRDGAHDLYLMEADGGNVRKVFQSLAHRECPAWSPDGQRLAYLRRDDWGIYVSTVNSEHEERVASPGFLGGCPSWSPDGSEIVFVSTAKPAGHQLKVINLQTHKERVLLSDGRLGILWGAVWSPDGTRIVFGRSLKGIYVVNNNGKGLGRLTDGVSPAWSPLSDELVYQRNGQLFKFNIGNRKSTRLTRGEGVNSNADWFDPDLLSVQPQASLLTTIWATIKQREGLD